LSPKADNAEISRELQISIPTTRPDRGRVKPVDALTSQQILDSGLLGWHEEDRALHASFAIANYKSAAAFLTEVAEIADAEDHHPDLTVTYGVVEVTMCTHSGGPKVTQRDIDMAQRISGVAAGVGLLPKAT
jgi:4a-hydroxytetrahydrobiopterin dehydratase